ncbi:MAG: hypothetical protein SCALA702_37940 [Melioribacteraceae bacterium]|nr:MAG: hypothetical protein SCALA702_37940 [Melioribacteraceae bacterium]
MAPNNGIVWFISRFKDISDFLKTRFSKQNTGEVLWFFGGQVLVFIASILVVKLLTGMGKTAYGEYSLILTNIAFWSLFIYNPVNQGFNRFYFDYNNPDSLPLYIHLIRKFLTQISLILFALSVIAGVAGTVLFDERIGSLIFLAGILTVFFKISEFSTSLLNIIRKRKFNSIVSSVERYSLIIFIIGLIYTDLLSLENVLLCYIGISILFGLVKFGKFNFSHDLKGNIDNSLKPEITQNLKLYILPFIAWGISGWLQLNGEKWVIANYLSAAEVGVYAVMLNIINAMISFPTYFITDFFTPHIFSNFASKTDKEKINAGYNYIKINLLIVVCLILTATIMNLVFGELFIKLISSDSYTDNASLLPILTVGTGFFYIGHVLTNVGLALGRTKEYVIPKVGAGLLSLTLNIIFIRIWGIAGVALALCFSGVIYVTYLYFVNRRLIREFGR